MSNIIKPLDHDIQNFLDEVKSKTTLESINTIIEVASCDGYHACEFGRTFPDAKIYTFEASPENQIDAENYIKNSGLTNVFLTKSAVSEIEGEINFYPIDKRYCPGSVGSSSCFEINPEYRVKEPVYQTAAIKVPSLRLDTFCDKNDISNIDLLWMDCQGSELSVMKSLRERLLTVKGIWIEAEFKNQYIGQPLEQEVKKFLEENGFEFVKYVRPGEWFSECLYINKKFKK